MDFFISTVTFLDCISLQFYFTLNSEALIVCEQKNIVHRDIKPANIFINEFGTFKLGDFGVARQTSHTQTNMTQIGTMNYMAPELYGTGKADHRVDIYSLGIMLYRLGNGGKFPFLEGSTTRPEVRQEALIKRLQGTPLPMPKSVDEELGKIILKACAYRPEDRYANANELKRDLERWKYRREFKVEIPEQEEASPIIKKEYRGGEWNISENLPQMDIFTPMKKITELPKEKQNVKNESTDTRREKDNSSPQEKKERGFTKFGLIWFVFSLGVIFFWSESLTKRNITSFLLAVVGLKLLYAYIVSGISSNNIIYKILNVVILIAMWWIEARTTILVYVACIYEPLPNIIFVSDAAVIIMTLLGFILSVMIIRYSYKSFKK